MSFRNQRIDLLRGWLILLVIIGHITLGSVHDNFIRYSIYAFHMPLFIGLSGYLINIEKLKSSGLMTLFLRYWWRVILPFAFAFLFFTGVLLIHAHQEGRLTHTLVQSYVTSPYYHLWFIPTLVIWVFALWGAVKLSIPRSFLLVVFAALTALWAVTDRVDLHPYLSVLLSKKVIYFFSFFLFGVWLRTAGSRKLMSIIRAFKVLPAALVMMCAVVYLINIGAEHTVIKGLAWLIMNLSLIAIGVAWATSKQHSDVHFNRAKVQVMIAMGRISLPIYLWHVVPMFLLKGWDIHQTQVYLYYTASILAVSAIVAILIKLEGKSTVLDRVLYGA